MIEQRNFFRSHEDISYCFHQKRKNGLQLFENLECKMIIVKNIKLFCVKQHEKIQIENINL